MQGKRDAGTSLQGFLQEGGIMPKPSPNKDALLSLKVGESHFFPRKGSAYHTVAQRIGITVKTKMLRQGGVPGTMVTRTA